MKEGFMSETMRPWTTDPDAVIRARVHRALHKRGARTDASVAEESGLADSQVAAAFADLIRMDFAEQVGPARMADTSAHEVRLTAAGAAQAEQFTHPKAGTLKRACAEAMLDWLADLDGDYVEDVTDLLNDPRGSYFGEPFSEDALHNAGEALLKDKLIDGAESFGPLAQPTITELGREVVEDYDGDLTAWRRRTPGHATTSITATITGSPGANLMAASPGSTQESRTSISQQANNGLMLLARVLEQSAPVLGDAREDNHLAEVIEDLRAAADGVAEHPGPARRAVAATKQLMLGASAGALGSEVFAPMCDQVLQLIQQLS